MRHAGVRRPKLFLRRENPTTTAEGKNAVRDTRGASEAHPETLRQLELGRGCRASPARGSRARNRPLHQSSGRPSRSRRYSPPRPFRPDGSARGNAPQRASPPRTTQANAASVNAKASGVARATSSPLTLPWTPSEASPLRLACNGSVMRPAFRTPETRFSQRPF